MLSCFATNENNSDSIKTTIELSPLQLFTATFQLDIERAIKNNFSLNISFSGTYGSKGGYGDKYLAVQEDNVSFVDNGYYYSPQMITGWGAAVQGRNYLNKNANAPLGIYAAPYLSFREVWLTSENYYYLNDAGIQKDITKELYIMGGGVVVGDRIALISKMFSLDFFVGAGLRLSKYADEDNFTRYKKWTSLDYSGVLPNAGIRIGILK